MFFLICFMWTFTMDMEGGRCFISYTVRLGQVVKWPFLMAWSKVFLTGLNRAAWYHLASSGLLLAARELSDYGCCFIGDWLGLVVRLTYHITDVVVRLTSSNVIPSLIKLR